MDYPNIFALGQEAFANSYKQSQQQRADLSVATGILHPRAPGLTPDVNVATVSTKAVSTHAVTTHAVTTHAVTTHAGATHAGATRG